MGEETWLSGTGCTSSGTRHGMHPSVMQGRAKRNAFTININDVDDNNIETGRMATTFECGARCPGS
jgi:hypothetical protein